MSVELPDVAPTLAITLATIVYAAGVRAAWRHAGHGRGVRRWQVWCFASGLIIVALALVSPLDALSDALFSAHMAQHVLLAVVAPPLLVAGAPVVAALWVLPARPRRRVVMKVARTHWLVASWAFATAPAVACALHAVAIWAWHAPRLYVLALQHPAAHALEHASFVGSASLIWWSILRPRSSRRAGYLTGIIILFVTMMQSGALGAILTLSHHAWYPAHAAGAAAHGMTPLEDQQLAGLIMWVVAGLLYLVEMSILFLAWMNAAARVRRTLPIAVAVALSAGACSREPQVAVAGGDAERGRAAIKVAGCGSCHSIDGVPGADGHVGAPLSGLAHRSIIAGELVNTPDNLVRWIADPPSIEPATAMPKLGLTDAQARDIAAYLYTLR